MNTPLLPGDVVIVDLGPTVGREQRGQRPAVVISSARHLSIADRLVTVMACTTRDRGWLNHIRLTGSTGLSNPTFAMTEQQRTIDRMRIVRRTGAVDPTCHEELRQWLHRWLM